MAPKATKKGSKMSSERSSLSSSCSESNQPVNDDDFSRNVLKKASTKYPSFISSSSFTGQITAIDSKPIGHAATIWLSESAMLSSSFLPGSLVSVSLAASSKTFLNGASPLESLEDECARHFGIDIGHSNGSNMGSFFAVAVVFPSCKVFKNGVRLSWSLSCTMGGPDTGRIVFVSPLGNQSISHSVNGVDLCDCTNTEVSRVPMYKCGELYLKFIPSRNGQRLLLDVGSPVDISKNISKKAGHDQFRAGQVSSPKTPSPYQSKLNSLGSSQQSLTSCQGSVASISDQFGEIPLDTSAIEKALEDEKTKRLLETSAAWWLCARRLLHGNLVVIPVGPQIGFFQVDYANKLFVEDLMNEGKQGSLPCEIPTYSPVNHVDAAFLIDSKTKLHLSSTSLSMETQDKGDLSLVEDEERFGVSKLGGLSKEYAELKQIILDKIHHDADYTGVLLHGPPGTGKTSLAWSCAYDVGVKLFSVNGPEVFSEDYGKSEKELHGVFDEAKKVAPALVFIDELDAIAPTRKDGSEHVSQRMVVTLLKLMDEIPTTAVLVIAATNRPDSVDPALRRHGRFDREIEIGVPTREQRLDILLTLLREVNHSLNDTEIQSLVSTTHGFVGADLAALCNRAALTALRRYIKLEGPCNFQASPDQHPLKSDSVDSNNFEKLLYLDNDQGDYVMKQEPLLKVTYGDFEKARMEVSPSAMREVMVEVPKVSWEDVGGQDDVKKRLIEAVEWPQKHQNAFDQVGIRPPSGVLMFGPPGCSKTLMARAVASNAGLNFLAVKGPELFSKWVGESEKAVRSLFAKARAAAPSIIFFDEIDGLAVTRGQENDGLSVDDRVSTQLLVELDGLKQRVNVTVIAATNRPDKIDPALLRPGRFDRLLYVGPPSEVDREDIFRIHLRKMLCGSDVSIKVLAHLTEGCTGADISSICREAALVALEENIDISEISMRHFEVAIGRLQPSEVQSYEELFIDFQRLGVNKDGGVK